MALSLNHLPSKYVVANAGEVYAKANHLFKQTQVDILSEVTRANMEVNANHFHPPDEVVKSSE